jgi:glycosyltransferase involved in cell wall biosynthesis
MRIAIFANAFTSLSGGDKIFVEYAKRWLHSGETVVIITNEKGRIFCLEHGLNENNIEVWKSSFMDKLDIYISGIYKTIISIVKCLSFCSREYDIVFSSSDFLPDIFSALIAKAKKRKIKWLAACYLLTPCPFSNRYSGYRLRALIFYYEQRIALLLIKNFANAVFTASEKDRNHFYNKRKLFSETVIAIRGGVDFKLIHNIDGQEIIYDAIFVGRFHPQKCVDELIKIWKSVSLFMPGKKLALIGNGRLESMLKKKVTNNEISDSVVFLGKVDDVEKIKLLKSSRIFISASRFDSGNIALDEALACGLPGIIYDLPQLFYPKGVIKVFLGDKEEFVKAILILLGNDKEYYRFMSREGISFASTLDWDIKAMQALKFIKSICR